MTPSVCAVCGDPDAYPMFGHTTPLCSACDRDWWASKEREAMARTRQDFVERRRGERGVVVDIAPARAHADKDWGGA